MTKYPEPTALELAKMSCLFAILFCVFKSPVCGIFGTLLWLDGLYTYVKEIKKDPKGFKQ